MPPPFSSDRLAKALAGLPAAARYLVGFSGGLDSTVLLYALKQLDLPVPLHAIHIHHGLHINADRWAEHCRALCARWQVPLAVLNINAQAEAGESPEAAARHARYAAFAQAMQADDCLLTAQHCEDQAETLLLQLLRGAGPEGLAAMPAWTRFAAGGHARPLLGFNRDALKDYALTQGLSWIDDDSNSDLRFDRNYLRHAVLPVLAARWPSYAKTLARAAEHQAEAATLLHDWTDAVLPSLCGAFPASLSISGLLAWSPAAQRSLIRRCLQQHSFETPSTAILEQLLAILHAAPDAAPLVCWGDNNEARRYRDDLIFLRSASGGEHARHDPQRVYRWTLEAPLKIESLGLVLRPEVLRDAGLTLPAGTPVMVKFRQGGERIVLPGRPGSRSLKNLLQERGVPPWLRDRLPLVYHEDGRLLGVFGIDPPIIGTVQGSSD